MISGLRGRRITMALALLSIGSGLVTVLPAPAVRADPPTGGTDVVGETFTGATVLDPSWTAQGRTCLTGAVAAPPAGAAQIPQCPATQSGPVPPRGVTPGYLQLTDASNNAAGSVLYNRPIPASAGISITMRQFQYGGTGADGIGFFLVDGATNLTATGANGGSLGYAQKDGTQQGVKGGYVGVGFDAFGNYYNDGESRGTGCPVGQRSPTTNSGPIAPNVITVRGPGNGLTGYCYQPNATVPLPITNPNAPGTTLAAPLRATTLAASEREINVQVTPDLPGSPARVIVQIRYAPQVVGNPWVTVLNIPAPAGIPSTYKFGLSASTGGSTDVHLVSQVRVATVTPLDALQLVKQVDRSGTALPAVITAGTTIPYQFTVTNSGLEALQSLTIVDSRIVGPIVCDRTTLTIAPAVGSTAVCKGSYVVTAADIVNPSIDNTATAHANPVGVPGTDVASNPSTAVVPLVSSLTLQKTVVTPAPYSVGQNVAYSYVLRNTGGSQLVNVAVSDNRVVAPARVSCPSNQLAPAATMTCTATYTVKAGDVGADGVLVNTAVASAQTEIGQQVTSNQSQGRINVFTDVGVTKVVDNPAPLVGSNVTFTITAANLGPSLAQQVVITDLLPAGRLDLVSATPAAGTTYDAATGKWNIPSLTVGSSVSLQIVATVLSNGPVTNSATRTAMTQTDINPANDSASVTISAVPTVDLSVTKAVDVADVPVGGIATFTIRVQNLGPSPATDVVLTDRIPPGLTYVPAGSGGDGTYDPATGLWTVGNLAVGATAARTLVVTSTQIGSYTNNVALLSSVPDDNNPGNNDASASLTVRAVNADLYVSKGVLPEFAEIGDQVVYQVEVGNKGPEAVQGVFAIDSAPPGLELSPTDPPVASKGTFTVGPGNDLRWDIGTLAVNETQRLTVFAVVDTAGTKVNTTKVDAPDLDDPTPQDNVATATLTTDLRPVDVGVTKSVTANSGAPIDRVPLGQTVTFAITATNHDTVNTATNVVFQDLLDSPLVVVSSAAGAGTTYDATTGEWRAAALAPGQTVTLQIVARVTAVGQSGNTISLASLDQRDTNPSNNAASATVTVVEEADLVITKSNDVQVAHADDRVTYTITVTNNGPNDSRDIAAYDPYLIEANIIGFSVPPTTAFDPVTRTWNIPVLANQASIELTVTVRVRPNRFGTFVNTVVVASTGVTDPVPDDNTATASLFIPSADIIVTKSVARPAVVVGDQVVFTIGLDNAGPDTADAVTVADLLPAGFTLVSATPSVGTYDAASGVWNLGDVTPIQLPRTRDVGTAATLQIVARADRVGTFTNTASSDRSSSFVRDPDPSNNAASATVTVSAQPADLSLTKTVSAATVTIGQPLTFTIVVTNAGPGAAENVVLADPFPGAMTPTSVSDPACSLAGQDVTCQLGTVAPGTTRQIMITALTNVVGPFTNTATLSSPTADPDPTSRVAAASGTVVEADTIPPGTLPATGSGGLGRDIPLAALLLVVGIGAAVIARRRRIN